MTNPPIDPSRGSVHVSLDLPDEHRGGVWANFARVAHSPYEFTLDFARLDFSSSPDLHGVVVARVNLSPMLITQLIRALESNWEAYAARAITTEVDDPGAPEA